MCTCGNHICPGKKRISVLPRSHYNTAYRGNYNRKQKNSVSIGPVKTNEYRPGTVRMDMRTTNR